MVRKRLNRFQCYVCGSMFSSTFDLSMSRFNLTCPACVEKIEKGKTEEEQNKIMRSISQGRRLTFADTPFGTTAGATFQSLGTTMARELDNLAVESMTLPNDPLNIPTMDDMLGESLTV